MTIECGVSCQTSHATQPTAKSIVMAMVRQKKSEASVRSGRRGPVLRRMALVEIPQHLVDEAHRRIIQPTLENAAQASASQSQARDNANEAGVSTVATRACRPVTLRTPSP